MSIPDEGTIREYYDLRQQLATYTADMRAVVNHPNYSLAFVQSGRLAQVKYMEHDFGWGVIINYQRRKSPKNVQEEYPPEESWVVDILLNVAEDSSITSKGNQPLPPGVRPPKKGEKARPEVVPVLLSCVHTLSLPRISVPNDLKSPDAKRGLQRTLAEVQRRFPDGLALLDPIEHMGITDDSFKKLLRVRETLTLFVDWTFFRCANSQVGLENRSA